MRDVVRHVRLIYTASGRTVDRHVRLQLSPKAVAMALEQLVVVSEGGEAGTAIESRDPVTIDFSQVPDHSSSEGDG